MQLALFTLEREEERASTSACDGVSQGNQSPLIFRRPSGIWHMPPKKRFLTMNVQEKRSTQSGTTRLQAPSSATKSRPDGSEGCTFQAANGCAKISKEKPLIDLDSLTYYPAGRSTEEGGITNSGKEPVHVNHFQKSSSLSLAIGLNSIRTVRKTRPGKPRHSRVRKTRQTGTVWSRKR